MSSKLLSRDTPTDARPFRFHNLNETEATPTRDGAARPSLDSAAARERDQLIARVADLEAELAKQVPAARAAGFREGEAIGRSQAEAAMKPVLDRMCGAVTSVIELKPRLRKEIEEDAVQLSLRIAGRILRRELSMDPSALHGLVQVTFDRLARQEISRVVVHPEQVAPIRACLGQLTTRQIDVVGDGSREKGSLIFETNRGTIDASVDTQLREIELGLADRLKWR